MQQVEASLDACGIRLWEMFRVDNSCCGEDAPLDLPSGHSAAGSLKPAMVAVA